MLPRATYRIQFGKGFGFDQAAAIALTWPISESAMSMTPRTSTQDRAVSMDTTLSINVPNHMGVGGADNPFWLDVLEWGQQSPYADWFDIDWHSHSEFLDGKLLVPFLGEQYGSVLEGGKLNLKFDAEHGEFSVWAYDEHKLPVTPLTYTEILAMTFQS